MVWKFKPAVWNPSEVPEEDLPTIYGFSQGGQYASMECVVISADGHVLYNCLSTVEDYMPADVGMTPNSAKYIHERIYKEHYPDGYKMEFVWSADVSSHAGLQEAFRLNGLLTDEEIG